MAWRSGRWNGPVNATARASIEFNKPCMWFLQADASERRTRLNSLVTTMRDIEANKKAFEFTLTLRITSRQGCTREYHGGRCCGQACGTRVHRHTRPVQLSCNPCRSKRTRECGCKRCAVERMVYMDGGGCGAKTLSTVVPPFRNRAPRRDCDSRSRFIDVAQTTVASRPDAGGLDSQSQSNSRHLPDETRPYLIHAISHCYMLVRFS